MLMIGICDDNPRYTDMFTRHISSFLRKSPYTFQLHTFPSFEAYDNFLTFSDVPLDILFLDIELENENGIALARRTNQVQPCCQIIFLTGHICYSTDIYETSHCYFILKSELSFRLPAAFTKAVHQIQLRQSQTLPLTFNGETYIVLQPDILYIEHWKRRSTFHTRLDTIVTYEKLDDLEPLLNQTCFLRCHESFIVNLDYIRSFQKTRFILRNDIEIPISRKYYKHARSSFQNWAKECMP